MRVRVRVHVHVHFIYMGGVCTSFFYGDGGGYGGCLMDVQWMDKY